MKKKQQDIVIVSTPEQQAIIDQCNKDARAMQNMTFEQRLDHMFGAQADILKNAIKDMGFNK